MTPKIERVAKEIDKTKGKIADLQNRLRDLERQKTNLENEKIVAMFRREKLSEDEFAALLRAPRGDESCVNTLETQEMSHDEEE